MPMLTACCVVCDGDEVVVAGTEAGRGGGEKVQSRRRGDGPGKGY